MNLGGILLNLGVTPGVTPGSLWGHSGVTPGSPCPSPPAPQRPPLDNYDCKLHLSAPPPPRFMVVTPRCAPPPHPPQPPWAEPRKLGPPQAPSSRRVSAEPDPEPPEDGDYSNEPFASGYVTVLPDPTPPSDVVDDVMAQPDDVIGAGEGLRRGRSRTRTSPRARAATPGRPAWSTSTCPEPRRARATKAPTTKTSEPLPHPRYLLAADES
ncbi:uncharacterized protein LOC118701108 [Molothrus ater]|uniref:uncharacterized protein LOC118701108 n=1 Tax=Molothrus ater TaxID=84834 RepID=UPI00174E8C08|nr:uncharacterized protein LOC118701108 [Molothrus ater]